MPMTSEPAEAWLDCRELEASSDWLEVLAFGSHSPRDSEMVADWWAT